MINFKRFFLFVSIFAFFVSCNIEPFEGEIPENIDNSLPETCEAAVIATSDASIDFSSATPSDSNYSELCIAYKNALEAQISVCGDQGGVFQMFIDSIGDCGEDDNTNNNEDGDYWPMSIGNKWTYTQKVTGMPENESVMEISDLVDYKDTPSYLYENFFGSIQGTDGTGLENLEVDYYTRKLDGDYEVLVGELTAEIPGLYKITQSEYDFVILKDNVDVGTTWDYDFDVTTSYEPISPDVFSIPDATVNYDIELEILEKDALVEVRGTTHTSVIKVKFTQKVALSGISSQTSTSENIYYFAKDIGLVKSEGTIFDADDNITSTVVQELTTFVIN